ncbi:MULTISPECIES: type IV secretory system conjugative DNA transfer family protein [unclassified Streptomyces]|uniref:type IV secretory system conjugative DNA transfer family protein n=1 Tax=unclassified Streptomyces TaxID=2593676 RepID=UPI00278BE10B|nr:MULTISPECIES: type IV secretory system conjugative DNA transfer family protein [unclassified Streptomyces]
MSRKKETTSSTSPHLSAGPASPWSCGIYKPSGLLEAKKQHLGYAAAGLPVAESSENGNLPGPSFGTFFDVVNMVASHFPLGGYPGFGVAAVASAGVGYLALKQKFDLGKSGPTASRNAAAKVGFATPAELKEWLSVKSMRKKVAILRPSLSGEKPRSISAHDLGVHLGTDLLHRNALYVTCEDLMLMIAPPRSGKSAQFGNAVIDAAGACIVTSTRGDLYEHTHELRAEHNRPIWTFNADISGVPNSVRWNLVEGCQDPTTAIRRAGYLLAALSSGEDMENASFWEGHSFTVLSSYLMAAALIDGDLATVRDWATNSTDKKPLEILTHERHRAHVPPAWPRTLRQMLDAPDRTRESVYLTLVRAFSFMSRPEVVDIVSPRPGEQRFDVQDFLRSGGTLYVMGRDTRNGGVAPLFAALIGEIYDAAYALANASPGGRLDPYLRLVLDEAAVICPLPLHMWSADAGGRNIQLLIAVQSRSQLRERWGINGAETLLNNCVEVVLGGLGVAKDLEEISQVCGEKDEEVATASTTDDDKQSSTRTMRRVRVMPPDAIRQMQMGTGLVLYRHLPPIRYHFTPVWERKDVKAKAKAAKAQEKLERKLKKQGVQVAAPVVMPPMPTAAPPLPAQQSAPEPAPAAEPGTAPGIPGQPDWLSKKPQQPWRKTG